MADPAAPAPSERAFERVSSVDGLDDVLHIVRPRDWLPIATLTVLLGLAALWAVVGRVPVTTTGRGILTHPRRVVDVQSYGAGQVDAINVKTGDVVRRGDVIGHLDQRELRDRLDSDRALLAALKAQDRAKASAQETQLALQHQQTALADVATPEKAASLKRSLAQAQSLAPKLRQRVESFHELQKRGLLPSVSPDVITAEQDEVTNEALISDLTVKLAQLELDQKSLQEIETALARTNLESDLARQTEMQQIAARIAVAENALEKDSTIRTEHDGRVLEVFITKGQVVPTGAPVASVQMETAEIELMNVAYFPAGEGKKIEPGMRVQVTPDSIERARFGGITGTVLSVSALPVTVEGSRAVVGSTEVARALMPAGAAIEVVARLDADPAAPSGYRWSSSQGPPTPIRAGITSVMRVTVEQRSPISFLLPFLRDMAGVE